MSVASIRLREDREQVRSQKHNAKIALTGGVREYPAESRLSRWLRQTGQFANRAYEGVSGLPKGGQVVYGTLIAATALAVLTSLLHLRFVLWPGIAWALLVVSAMVAIGVIVNILIAMTSMYVGYLPVNDATTAAPTRVRGEMELLDGGSKMAGARGRRLADALNDLRLAEENLSKLGDRIAFRSLSYTQKYQYYQVLVDVRTLIHEISNQSSRQKIAS